MKNFDRLHEGAFSEGTSLADDVRTTVHSPLLATVEFPQSLPILPLRGLVVYPHTAVPLNVGQPRSIRLLESTSPQNGLIGLCASYDKNRAAPGPDEIYRIGTIGSVHRQLRRKDGTIRMLVNGLQRFRIKEFITTDPFLVAEIEPLPEDVTSNTQSVAMTRNLVDMFMRLAEYVPSIPGDLLASSLNLENPLQLVYTVATYLQLELNEAQQFLEFNTLSEKLAWLVRHIGQETEIMEMGQRIRSEAVGQMEQAQREYFLREQLKAIQRELGEADERELEARTFREKIEAANMPAEAHQEAERELNRLTRLPVAAAEYGVVRTYLEWLVNLPWDVATTDNLDLRHARTVLDEDHHGLDEVKERIVEFLAVRRLRQGRMMDGEWGTTAVSTPTTQTVTAPSSALLARPALAKPRWAAPLPGPWAASLPASPWAACATRPKFAATAAPTSARCPAASCKRCAAVAATTPWSFWTRSTSWGLIFAAIRRRLCWKCWTQSKTTPSAIITWTCPSIFPA
jgi:Lon protease-like protein